MFEAYNVGYYNIGKMGGIYQRKKREERKE